jgi:hypothetical protein
MASVIIAMAFTPSHRAEFWTSMVSIAFTLLVYVVFRRRGSVALGARESVSQPAASADAR